MKQRSNIAGTRRTRALARTPLVVLASAALSAGPLGLTARAATPQSATSPAGAAAPTTVAVAGAAEWPLAADCFDAPRLWALSTGAGITVAVVDTGVDAASPDLVGRVLPGVDLTDQAADGRLDTSADSHGTSVAGVIAADGASGGSGRMTGLAPGAVILPVRIAEASTRVQPAVVAEGIVYAASHGARIINLSLGTTLDVPEIHAAVTAAIRHGVLVVAAAGNSGGTGNQPMYPAAIPGVLAVAGTARDGSAWAKSESGPYVTLAAPAEAVYSTNDDGGHLTAAGTSYAAPYVSAAAALVWSRYPRETPGQIITRLIETADPVGAAHGRDDRSGFGRVDPYRALTAPVPTSTIDPLLADAPAARAAAASGTGGGGSTLLWTTCAAAAAVLVLLGYHRRRRRRSAAAAAAPAARERKAATDTKTRSGIGRSASSMTEAGRSKGSR